MLYATKQSRSFNQVLCLDPTRLSLCIRLVLFFLICTQCIEINPAPAEKDASGYGQPTGRGSSRGKYNSPNQGRIMTRNATAVSAKQISKTGCLVESTYAAAVKSPNPTPTRASQRQGELNHWLSDSDTYSSSNLRVTAESFVPTEQIFGDNIISDTSIAIDFNPLPEQNSNTNPSNLDTNALLLEIRGDVKSMNAKFDKLERSVSALQSENMILKEQNKILSEKVELLTNSVDDMKKSALENEMRSERLEAQSRRDNLKFYGIEDKRNETWEEAEDKVRREISNLGIDECSISIRTSSSVTKQCYYKACYS